MTRSRLLLFAGTLLAIATAALLVPITPTRHIRASQTVAPPDQDDEEEAAEGDDTLPIITTPAGSSAVEQRAMGTRPAATTVASFDGLGVGFQGPQGSATLRNPSDARAV